MKLLTRAAVPVAILAAGFGAWKWLATPVEKPKPQHHAPQRLQTEKTVLNPTSYEVIIETQGNVRSEQAATITPLVAGTVRAILPSFEDGAFFKKGDVLLELNPADLQTAVFASESRLARAEAALIQEQARGKQAQLNWDEIAPGEDPSPLVLRISQLKEAEANFRNSNRRNPPAPVPFAAPLR
jgi:multidrug efflux pump subunit AcrA (membrane-fusion protein)